MYIPKVIATQLAAKGLDVKRVSNALNAWVGQQLHGISWTATTRVRVGKIPSATQLEKGKYQLASINQTLKRSGKKLAATPIHVFAAFCCDVERWEESGTEIDAIVLPVECTAWLAKFAAPVEEKRDAA